MIRWLAVLAGIVLGAAWTPVAAQDPESAPPPRFFRPGPPWRGEGGRGEWRERMRRFREASPEQRRQMEIDGWLRGLDRTYELSAEQETRVRDELVKMREEYRASMGPDAEELDRLRQAMDQYWRTQRESGDDSPVRRFPRDDPQFQELRQRMREITQRHPIDWEGSIERVEALLPPEQVARGRERRQQWMQRAADWRRQREEQDRQSGRDDLERRRDRQRDRARLAENEGAPPAPPPPPRLDAATTPRAPAAPPHPWDSYTEKFIAERRLTREQTASALAILKDLKDREAALRRAQAPARAEAERLISPQARAAKLQGLDAQTEPLFQELQARLESLLTAEQRQSAK